MDPLITAGLIQGGAQMFGNMFQNWSNRGLANDQREWSENMQQRQWEWNQQQWMRERDWNYKMWEEMNRYNSPQEQMARFREAGLNPHLIYGKGSAGTAGSPAQVGSVRAPDVKQYTRPEMRSITQGLDVFGMYTQGRMLEAQRDNVLANTQLAKQEALVKTQDAANRLIQGKQWKLDYKRSKELFDTQVDAAKVALQDAAQTLRKKEVDTRIAIKSENWQLKRIEAEMKLAIKNKEGKALANALEAIRLDMRRRGIEVTDSKFWRIAAQNYEEIKGELKSNMDLLKWLKIK